jgi:hypothetical protein
LTTPVYIENPVFLVSTYRRFETIKDQGLMPAPKDKRLAHEADPEYGVSKDCET